MSGSVHSLDGAIGACGFGSGNRVVIGNWEKGPIGPFNDLMWAEPDGYRTLWTDGPVAADFITAVYQFDDVRIAPELRIQRSRRSLRVEWSMGKLDFRLGRTLPFPPRPDWVTERIEPAIARRIMGVETFGVSPSGVEELYRADGIQRIVSGWGVVAGEDLGPIGSPTPAVGFGFSEPPPFPSLTLVRPRLRDPSGRLDAVVAAGRSSHQTG